MTKDIVNVTKFVLDSIDKNAHNDEMYEFRINRTTELENSISLKTDDKTYRIIILSADINEKESEN